MIMKCTNCNIDFNKAPSEIKKSKTGNHFCSRSCSISFNNAIKPKRKPIERICSCGNKFIPKYKSSRRLCISCQEKRMT